MNSARLLTYRFFELPYIVRVEIARDLGLLEDAPQHDTPQFFEHVFTRAVEADLLSQLWNKVEESHNDGKYASNPFEDETTGWVKSIITGCWLMVICGHCNKTNWIFVSDPDDDSSKVDDEGMTCWNCKKDSYFEPYIGEQDVPAEDEALVLVDGKENP